VLPSADGEGIEKIGCRSGSVRRPRAVMMSMMALRRAWRWTIALGSMATKCTGPFDFAQGRLFAWWLAAALQHAGLRMTDLFKAVEGFAVGIDDARAISRSSLSNLD
jgi:hypothetical protein